MKQILLGLMFLIISGTSLSPLWAQGNVFNPNDPVITYDSTHPPVKPPNGVVGKWVRTVRVTWNTTEFKCYIFNGIPFRLKFPKNYDSTKSYPLYVFFHGKLEGGDIYDNEHQLYLGGQVHMTAVDKGLFNGFLLYPQSQLEYWPSSSLSNVDKLIETVMIPQLKIDPFRIYLNGLSAGGNAAWNFFLKYTKLIAAFTPISASSSSYIDSVNNFKFTPIWHFQGALDDNPAPATSHALGNKIMAAGSNYKYTEFSYRGHDCWYQAWAMPDYFPFYNRAYKSNPWALGGRFEFCPGDPILDTLGVTPGFDGYEWRKDGVTIPGATQNTLIVTQLGTYDCRIKSGTVWSDWSPSPAVIKIKSPTTPPVITINGLATNVFPAPDNSTGVDLMIPDNYISYSWQKDGDTTTLSTTNTITVVSTPANYKVKVMEKWGCAFQFSTLFPVINANGLNGPPPVSNLVATAISKSLVRLTWSQDPNPAFNETAFEIYQATSAGGPYTLVAKTAANATNVTIRNLIAGTQYFYKVRAVNNNAASTVVLANCTIPSDTIPPTTPSSLTVGSITSYSVQLKWNASQDDVKVIGYDIYINGVKNYVSTTNSYIVYNLLPTQTYTFVVKARDATGNTSGFSNQVAATTLNGKVLIDSTQSPINSANYSVYVNFNFDNPAAAPWNNTNILPSQGSSFKSLRNYRRYVSGMYITILDNFSGYNPDGVNTGNNSGIYPDNVMRSSYYCAQGTVATMKVSGLNTTYRYSFIFFGSRAGSGDRTSVYTIGNQSVSLNASNNSKTAVRIDNVTPDIDGSVIVQLSLGPTAQYAYLNSMIIMGYSPETFNNTSTNRVAVNPAMLNPQDLNANAISAYPNPFTNDVTLSIPVKQNIPSLLVKVTDISGRIISIQRFKDIRSGIWQQRINLDNNDLQPGIYLLQIEGLPENKLQVIKLVKRK
jgi:predicted esterase